MHEGLRVQILDLFVKYHKTLIVLFSQQVSACAGTEEELTDPRHSKRSDQLLDHAPESLARLPIRQTESDALARMVHDLASPLMAVSVEDGDSEAESRHEFGQEAPLNAAAMELTIDIVQKTDGDKRREMFEQLLHECERVMLFLA